MSLILERCLRQALHKPSLNKKLYYETKSTIKENQQWSTLYLFLGSISLKQLAESTKMLHQSKYV